MTHPTKTAVEALREALQRMLAAYEGVYDCVKISGGKYQSQDAVDAERLARSALASTERAPEPDALQCGHLNTAQLQSLANSMQDTIAGLVERLRELEIAAPAAAPAGEPVGTVLRVSVAGYPMQDSSGVEWTTPISVGTKLFAVLAAPPVETLTDEKILDKWEEAQCDSSLHGTEERVLSFARTLFHPAPQEKS